MYKKAKGFWIFTVIIMCLAITVIASACNNKPTEQEPIQLADITFPTLRQGQLDIEWLGGSYSVTKPTLIYFHGEMPNGADSNVAFELPEEEYPDTIISDNYKKVKDRNLTNLRDLSYYWSKAGFNVGIFHYEQFADDIESNVYAKLFDNSFLSYKSGGTLVTREQSTLSHSLTEVFVARFLDYMSTKPVWGNEIRFVGNGVGASFALSATEYLHSFYNQDKISGNFVPRRVTLCDPYLANQTAKTQIDWKVEDNYSVSAKEITSALQYSADSVSTLNMAGVIFEYIESNEDVQEGYSDSEKDEYLTILQNTANLEYRQTYSMLFSENYLWQKRVSLDWYLYSVNGSDVGRGFDTDGNIRKDATYPFLDNYFETSDRGSLIYGLSAWTPTTFTKAIVGHSYSQFFNAAPSNPNSPDNKLVPFVLEKFQAENYQKSDITVPFICGYIFLDANSNQKIDDGFGAFLSNVEITIEYRDVPFVKTVKTDQTGFFKVELDSKAYSNVNYVDIKVKRPSHKYQFMTAVNDSYYNDYMRMDMANMSEQADSMYLSSYTKSGAKIVNCGLKPTQ